MSSRLKNEAGYSLVEVMVAIMILALAIIPMVGMFDAGLRAAVLGSNYDEARALANEKLEEVKVLAYAQAVSKYPPPTSPHACAPAPPADSGFSCEVETGYARINGGGVVLDSSSRTMMQVEVTVTWDGGEYTTTGLIAAGGA